MDGISRISRPEMVFITVTGLNGEKCSKSDRPKHKSVGRMQDLVGMFSKPDDLVLDLLSVTIAMAKRACKFRGTIIFRAAKLM